MNVVKSQLDKFGVIFIVASMVPSLAFITVCLVAFEPILPGAIILHVRYGLEGLYEVGFLVFIPTIILGFTLSSLNTYILKFYEGYIFLHRFAFLKRRQIRKARELQRKREKLARRINRLERRDNSQRSENELSILKDMYYQIAANYDLRFPPLIDQVLPTGFGNILKAAEHYSTERYGIDADFEITNDGKIKWISNNRPEENQVFTVSYEYTPKFRVLEHLHFIRDMKEEEQHRHLPQQVLIRIDYLSDTDQNGNVNN